MSKNNEELNPTTVRLTEKAQKVKDELAKIFGLKNILSAGLILFGKLSDSEQKNTIAEANSLLDVSDQEKKLAQKVLADARAHEAKQLEKKGVKPQKAG